MKNLEKQTHKEVLDAIAALKGRDPELAVLLLKLVALISIAGE